MESAHLNPTSYRPIDPFSTSTNYRQTIRNLVGGSDIENIDDIPLPPSIGLHRPEPLPLSRSTHHHRQQAPQTAASESPTNTEPVHRHGHTFVQINQSSYNSYNSSVNYVPTHQGEIGSQTPNHHNPEQIVPASENPGALVENSFALSLPRLSADEQSRGSLPIPDRDFNSIFQAAQNIIMFGSEESRGRRQSEYQVLSSRANSSSNECYSHSAVPSIRHRSPSISPPSTRSPSRSPSISPLSTGFPSRSSYSSSHVDAIYDVEEGISPGSCNSMRTPAGSSQTAYSTFSNQILEFVVIVLQQIYLHTLLRLPRLYLSRVGRIYEESSLSIGEMKLLALQAGAVKVSKDYMIDKSQSRLIQQFGEAWENFINNLMKEWKTTNVISALILTAVMTLFQIQAVSQDPVTRYLAFWSLFCALNSLLFGYILMLLFDAMRPLYKAVEWALETREMLLPFFWNAWIMLSQPVVWLTWSIIAYISCIVCLMWRSSANSPPSAPPTTYPPSMEHGFRILDCLVLGVGITYGVCLVKTFRRFGYTMEKAWDHRIRCHLEDQAQDRRSQDANYGRRPPGQLSNVTVVDSETREQVDENLSTANSVSSHPGDEGRLNLGGAESINGDCLSHTYSTNAAARSREIVYQDIELEDCRTYAP